MTSQVILNKYQEIRDIDKSPLNFSNDGIKSPDYDVRFDTLRVDPKQQRLAKHVEEKIKKDDDFMNFYKNLDKNSNEENKTKLKNLFHEKGYEKILYNNSVSMINDFHNKKSSILNGDFEVFNNDLTDTTGLGYDKTISTLAMIDRMITLTQKFYKVDITKFVPSHNSSYGAWGTQIHIPVKKILNDPDISKSFYGSPQAYGVNPLRPSLKTGYDLQTYSLHFWGKQIDYSIFDLYQMRETLQLDLITELLLARKEIFDLEKQEALFLGVKDTSLEGLLTLSNVTSNTTLITKKISDITDPDELVAFVRNMIDEYLTHTNNTVMANTLVIPRSDYIGLTGFVNNAFPVKTKLQYLKEALATVVSDIKTDNQVTEFEILPLLYCQKSFMTTRGENIDRYIMYNRSPDTLEHRQVIPFTTLPFFPNGDGTTFRSEAYMQMSGVMLKRPQEILYFDNLNA